jgi:hypothetical protein
MASLIPRIQTSTCSSSSHPLPQRQDSRLLFSDAWFIVAKFLLIILQLLSCLTHHFMSFIDSFFKTSSYDQVASIDIQYLEVSLDQFFLSCEQGTSVEPS